MLALQYANRINAVLEAFFAAMHVTMPKECMSGWYYDTDNNWSGWRRVISLDGGEICFHIPDSFDVGNLPEIEPNWDGHTTKEKWNRIAKIAGAVVSWET